MGLIDWFKGLWKQYKENQKRRELYERLDRNAAGKWSKKQYMKDVRKAVKLKKDEK